MRRYLKTAAYSGLSLAVAALLAGPWVSQAAAQQDQGEQQKQNDESQLEPGQPDNDPSQQQNSQDAQQPPPPQPQSFSDRPVEDAQIDDQRGDYGGWSSGRVYRGYHGGYAGGSYGHVGYYGGGYGSCGSHGGSYQNYPPPPPGPNGEEAAGSPYWSGNARGQYVQRYYRPPHFAQQYIDPQRTVLGIQVHDGGGTRIAAVRPGSPAENAGLQEADVIVSVNGQRLQSKGDLIDRIAGMAPKDDVTLIVQRDGQEMELTSRLTTYGQAFGDRSAIAEGDLPPPPPSGTARKGAEERMREFGEGTQDRRTVARPPLGNEPAIDEMQREIDRLKQENEDLRQLELRDKSGENQIDPPAQPEAQAPPADEASEDLDIQPPDAPDADDEAQEETKSADDSDQNQGNQEDEAEDSDRPEAIQRNDDDEAQDETDSDTDNDE